MDCLECGKKLKTSTKYCSNKCQFDYRYAQYIQRWKVGEETGIRGWYNISRHIVRYLFEKYDSKCSSCGWSIENVYSGTVPLEVNHIDGDYKNNREENLELICPNCHALTKSYKNLNAGKGRKSRSKYYK